MTVMIVPAEPTSRYIDSPVFSLSRACLHTETSGLSDDARDDMPALAHPLAHFHPPLICIFRADHQQWPAARRGLAWSID